MAGFKIESELGATVFSILSGLSALFFTAWVFSPGGCAGPKKPVIEPVPVATAEAEALRLQLAAAEQSLQAEAGRRTDLALQLRETQDRLAGLESELTTLRTAQTGAATEAAELRAQSEALSAKNAELNAKLKESGALDAAALSAEVARLTGELAGERKACAAAKAELTAEVGNLQQKLDQALYGEQLKPAGDFPALDLPFLVNDPIELHRKVRPLFIGLRGVKEEDAKLDETYAKLSAGGSTSAIHRVPFASGSAEVVPAETAKLRELLKDTPKGAKFLVVGYASADGDAKSNHELSSQRASSVAATLAEIEGIDGGAVEAVYFGQTKRFSATDMAPNRVVEVWLVK